MSVPVSVSLVVVSLALGLPVLAAAQAMETHASLHGVTDSAALAAADAHYGWVSADPCAIAFAVVQTAGATLEACVVEWGTLRVVTSAHTVFGRVHAEARAGP